MTGTIWESGDRVRITNACPPPELHGQRGVVMVNEGPTRIKVSLDDPTIWPRRDPYIHATSLVRSEPHDENILRRIYDRRELVRWINERVAEGNLDPVFLQGFLDDYVHINKAREGAVINNDGVIAQVKYLSAGDANCDWLSNALAEVLF